MIVGARVERSPKLLCRYEELFLKKVFVVCLFVAKNVGFVVNDGDEGVYFFVATFISIVCWFG